MTSSAPSPLSSSPPSSSLSSSPFSSSSSFSSSSFSASSDAFASAPSHVSSWPRVWVQDVYDSSESRWYSCAPSPSPALSTASSASPSSSAPVTSTGTLEGSASTAATRFVRDLKQDINVHHSAHPPLHQQRLIWNGRILFDNEAVPQDGSLVLAISRCGASNTANASAGAPTAVSAAATLPAGVAPTSLESPRTGSNKQEPLRDHSSSLSEMRNRVHRVDAAAPYKAVYEQIGSSFIKKQKEAESSSIGDSKRIESPSERLDRATLSRTAPLSTPLPVQTSTDGTSLRLNQQPQQASSPAPAAPLPVAQASRISIRSLRRFVDLRLLLKLVVLILVFSRQGDMFRSSILVILAVIAYLWQVGAFRRDINQEGLVGEDVAVAGIRAARRQARAAAFRQGLNPANENAPPAADAGGRLAALLDRLDDPNEEEDFEDDLVAQRDQMAQLAAQHRAELIRRRPDQVAARPAYTITTMQAMEKFIVGLFASLLPSWRYARND